MKLQLLKYTLACIAGKDLPDPDGRKILTPLLIVENYFDGLVLEAIGTEYIEPEIQWVVDARAKAFKKFPIAQVDFISENIRMLYLLKLVYLG